MNNSYSNNSNSRRSFEIEFKTQILNPRLENKDHSIVFLNDPFPNKYIHRKGFNKKNKDEMKLASSDISMK